MSKPSKTKPDAPKVNPALVPGMASVDAQTPLESKPSKTKPNAPKVNPALVPGMASVDAQTPPESETPPEGDLPPAVVEELPFRAKRAREVFASHTVEDLFFTSDDECFVSQQFAVLHAQTLPDQTVTPFNRKETE